MTALKLNLAYTKTMAGPRILFATTARVSIRAIRNAFSALSSGSTRRQNSPAPVSALLRCKESFADMAEKFGRKGQSKKGRRFILLCNEINGLRMGPWKKV